MISHDSFEFKEKLSQLMDLEQSAHILNTEILEHGRQCVECLSDQINAGVLPEMYNPLNSPAQSAEEFFYLMRN